MACPARSASRASSSPVPQPTSSAVRQRAPAAAVPSAVQGASSPAIAPFRSKSPRMSRFISSQEPATESKKRRVVRPRSCSTSAARRRSSRARGSACSRAPTAASSGSAPGGRAAA